MVSTLTPAQQIADLQAKLYEANEHLRLIRAEASGFILPRATHLHLSRRHRQLVSILHRHLGKHVTTPVILAAMSSLQCECGGQDVDWHDTTLRAQVSRVNRALEGSPYKIVTHWGAGYSLTATAPAALPQKRAKSSRHAVAHGSSAVG